VGRVRSVHRYPVKSLAGETLQRARVDLRGLTGDRAWAVRDPDGKLGSGKSSRRFRKMDGLLSLVARYDGDVPVIELEDGTTYAGDDPSVHEALSAYVGRPVSLAREADVSHFDDGPVHLLTSASLHRLESAHGAPVDAAHFRPNLVLDTGDGAGFVEDAWVGRRLAVGSELVLAIRATMPRCVMVTLAQKGLAGDGGLLRTTTDTNQGDLGVVADVVTPGVVEVGHEARLLA
jgi:uncharacterized protein